MERPSVDFREIAGSAGWGVSNAPGARDWASALESVARQAYEQGMRDAERARQSQAARAPRGSGFMEFVEWLIAVKPGLGGAGLISELSGYEGAHLPGFKDLVIERVDLTAGVIEWRDRRKPAGILDYQWTNRPR